MVVHDHTGGFHIHGGTPKWMLFHEKSIYEWMIWGYPHFRKPPFHENKIVFAHACYFPEKTIVGDEDDMSRSDDEIHILHAVYGDKGSAENVQELLVGNVSFACLLQAIHQVGFQHLGIWIVACLSSCGLLKVCRGIPSPQEPTRVRLSLDGDKG